jgi:hypothetical protein
VSKASGVVLILAGVGIAAYLLPLSSEADPQNARQGDFVTGSLTQGFRFTPVGTTPLPAAPKPPGAPPVTAAEVAPPPTSVVVTLSHRAEPPSTAPGRSLAPVPKDPEALTRELQKELRRVGCYDGEISGAWTPLSRRAMKTFTDRINASLPVERPDAILLTLVQGQPDRVCGKPCPAGEGLSQDGHCLPNGILAKLAKKGTPAAADQATRPDVPAAAITGWSTTTTAASPPRPPVPPLEGRMALAGPTTEPAAAVPPPRWSPPPVTRSRERSAHRGGPSRSYERRAPSYSGGQRTFSDRVFRNGNSIF